MKLTLLPLVAWRQKAQILKVDHEERWQAEPLLLLLLGSLFHVVLKLRTLPRKQGFDSKRWKMTRESCNRVHRRCPGGLHEGRTDSRHTQNACVFISLSIPVKRNCWHFRAGRNPVQPTCYQGPYAVLKVQCYLGTETRALVLTVWTPTVAMAQFASALGDSCLLFVSVITACSPVFYFCPNCHGPA